MPAVAGWAKFLSSLAPLFRLPMGCFGACFDFLARAVVASGLRTKVIYYYGANMSQDEVESVGNVDGIVYCGHGVDFSS